MIFSNWSPKFCYCYVHVVLPAKAATAEGLTFSDPSASNLNLYDFCHSPKALTAVSPYYFTNILFVIIKKLARAIFQSVSKTVKSLHQRTNLLFN
jgi:hypothetical protein